VNLVLYFLFSKAEGKVKDRVYGIAEMVHANLESYTGSDWAPIYAPLLMLNDDEEIRIATIPVQKKMMECSKEAMQAKVLSLIDEAAEQIAAESAVTTPTTPTEGTTQEDNMSKSSTTETPKAPKGRVETQSQRQERIKLRNAAATTPATEPAKTEDKKETPVTTPTTPTEAPKTQENVVNTETQTPAAAAAATETPKVEEGKKDEKKLPSTVLGTIRCWLHNMDESARTKFGPLPGSKEFGKLAESLKLACEGEEKALISPKGKGDAKDALIKGMNVLVEAAATAKHRMFTVQVNGKDVHAPTRILELEGVIKTLKNAEKQAAERELSILCTARDNASTKWGTDAAVASASEMKKALQAMSPEDQVKLAVNVQALGNYGIVRNLPEGEARFVVKGFKPEITTERVKELATPYVEAEGLKITDEMIKGIKTRVESIKDDAAYQKLLSDVALIRSQIARLLKAEPGEEKKIEAMQQKSMSLAIVGGIIDEMRVGSTAPTLNGWGMQKENAPVWMRDHDILVGLILSAKDGEHSLPGCGEDKKETVGKLAASMLVTFAYGAQTPDGSDLICHEWQVVLDGIKNAKLLAEQATKPGFRGYGRQICWGLYVGTRWLVLRIAGLINWIASPVKGAWFGLKALVCYGMGVATSGEKSAEWKASAKAALKRSGECMKDIVMIPVNGIKSVWNSIFGGKKTTEDNKGTSAPNTDKKEDNVKNTFAQNLGLANIMDYPFGKEVKDLKGEEKSSLGTKWGDQTTGQKVATVVTLPFRAVKRVVVAQTAISVGVIAGGIAGGVVGSMVLGTVGVTTVAAVAVGVVVGGLLGWGAKKLFGKKSDEAKAPEAPKAPAATDTAPEAPVAAPAQQAAA
jgi:hypothetical protein